MFGVNWHTSERKYEVLSEEMMIPVSDGVKISAVVFRPKTKEKVPAILSMHPYINVGQYAPIRPMAIKSILPGPGADKPNASLEAGDPNFYARRGYAHVLANVRGTGKSEGYFEFFGKREIRDVYDVIGALGKESWCDGKVGMFGVSYLAGIQWLAAALNPPNLKCVFAPWGYTDFYRDQTYHGGIFAYRFILGWCKTSLAYSSTRFKSMSLEQMGKESFEKATAKLLEDEDIASDPELVEIIKHPLEGYNPIVVDFMLHPFDDAFWQDRRTDYSAIKVPSYLGADWGMVFLHLPAAFRTWENLKVPKRMMVGPPIYLDRPVYQLQYESLRWFDFYMKGIETGITKEAPIEIFIMGENKWKKADSWPLPETKWTPFYLHENEILSEHETWPNEGSDSYFDSPWGRGRLSYFTPPLVEDTEVIGPIVLNMYASSTDKDALFHANLIEDDGTGKLRIVTRGWLRASHREVDPSRSKPWFPFHPHTSASPLEPNKVYEFNIPIIPTANYYKAGKRIGLSISSVDNDVTETHGNITHIRRQNPSRITIYHNDEFPSHVLLPITAGNLLETFFSGGKL